MGQTGNNAGNNGLPQVGYDILTAGGVDLQDATGSFNSAGLAYYSYDPLFGASLTPLPTLAPQSVPPALAAEPASISQAYSVPFVRGSGLNGVGNFVRGTMSLWHSLFQDAMKQCEMCTPSLGTLLRGGAPAGYVRVGRWMSPEELAEMQASGRVVESNLNGVTSVTYPPSSTGWTPPSGRVFAQFDVPVESLRGIPSPNGWAKIYGPNSMFADYLEITEMPEALNIEVLP
ncbi:MAG: hypothetical protein WAL56_17800 [Candidatus Sulfotelmatobacter sp.]